MAALSRAAAAAAVAAVLVREGVDYAQSKAVFKAASRISDGRRGARVNGKLRLLRWSGRQPE